MPAHNPYVGPRSFETGEALFGREREVRQLSNRLIAERIVLLHSPSGAGKSSLVRAGLVPHLRSDGFFVHPIIRVNQEIPQELLQTGNGNKLNRYMMSVLISLEEAQPEEDRIALQDLINFTLNDYLASRARKDGRDGPEFLLFDQFEEILTVDPTDRAAKTAFFTELGSTLRNRNRWAVFASRTDYVGALEPYTRLVPTYFNNTFILELLGVDAAREAIQKPARRAGVNFTLNAANKLLDDLRRMQIQQADGTTVTQLGPSIEPVQLQVVCYRLWETRDPSDLDIDEKDLASVGDVNQSLAEYYALSLEKVSNDTGISLRSLREWIDQKLISPDGIRIQVRLGADHSDGLPNAAIRQLENAHIIRAEKRAGQTWFELAHDRLIEPVRTDNRNWFNDNLNLFQRQAILWAEKNRSESLLLRGDELREAELEAASLSLTNDEAAFLEACRIARRRFKRDQTQRRLIIAAFILTILLFMVTIQQRVSVYNAQATADHAKNEAAIQQTAAADAKNEAAIQQTAAADAKNEAAIQQTAAAAAQLKAVTQEAEADQAKAAAKQAQDDAEQAKKDADEAKAKLDEQSALARANALVGQSILAETRGNRTQAVLLAIEAFKLNDIPVTRQQLINYLYITDNLYITQSQKNGFTTSIGFTNDNLTLASNTIYGCSEDTLLFCTSSLLKFWQITFLKDAISGLTQQDTFKQGTMDAMAVSQDGKTIAAVFCEPDEKTPFRCSRENLYLLDAATRQPIGEMGVLGTGTANNDNVPIAYGPDEKIIAVGITYTTGQSRIILWDTQTNKEIGYLSIKYATSHIDFSPDGKTLAAADETNLIIVDVDTLRQNVYPIENVIAGNRAVSTLVFSPDGSTLATGHRDGSITLWNTSDYETPGKVISGSTRVRSLAFSPDNKILAAGYSDFSMLLWDTQTRQRTTRPIFKHKSTIMSLAFSSDGKYLVSAGEEVVLWSMDPEVWIDKACSIAKRNFTPEEWDQYFVGQEYRTTCP